MAPKPTAAELLTPGAMLTSSHMKEARMDAFSHRRDLALMPYGDSPWHPDDPYCASRTTSRISRSTRIGTRSLAWCLRSSHYLGRGQQSSLGGDAAPADDRTLDAGARVRPRAARRRTRLEGVPDDRRGRARRGRRLLPGVRRARVRGQPARRRGRAATAKRSHGRRRLGWAARSTSGRAAVCEHLWATIVPWRKPAYEWCPHCDSRRPPGGAVVDSRA